MLIMESYIMKERNLSNRSIPTFIGFWYVVNIIRSKHCLIETTNDVNIVRIGCSSYGEFPDSAVNQLNEASIFFRPFWVVIIVVFYLSEMREEIKELYIVYNTNGIRNQ